MSLVKVTDSGGGLCYPEDIENICSILKTMF